MRNSRRTTWRFALPIESDMILFAIPFREIFRKHQIPMFSSLFWFLLVSGILLGFVYLWFLSYGISGHGPTKLKVNRFLWFEAWVFRFLPKLEWEEKLVVCLIPVELRMWLSMRAYPCGESDTIWLSSSKIPRIWNLCFLKLFQELSNWLRFTTAQELCCLETRNWAFILGLHRSTDCSIANCWVFCSKLSSFASLIRVIS